MLFTYTHDTKLCITDRERRDWMLPTGMPMLLDWLVWIAWSSSMTVLGARVCWMRWPLMYTLKLGKCKFSHNKLGNFKVDSTISANVVQTDFV